MKKIILTIAAIFAFGLVNAQDGMSFGLKGGLDLVSFKSDGGSESLTGFFVGGLLEFGISDQFRLQPGVNYHSASKTVAGEKLKADFVSVPVLVKYEIAEKFHLMAGPALYYSLESEDEDKARFNFEVGAAYDITENFFVEPRYSVGATGETKVSHILVGVGYKF